MGEKKISELEKLTEEIAKIIEAQEKDKSSWIIHRDAVKQSLESYRETYRYNLQKAAKD